MQWFKEWLLRPTGAMEILKVTLALVVPLTVSLFSIPMNLADLS